MNLEIRTANISDLEEILAFDPIGEADPGRIDFIRASIQQNECLIVAKHARIVGYGIMNYSFFGCGFISLVVTDPEFRREGVATTLLNKLEDSCNKEKLFLTTNQSNRPMQALAEKLGYCRSGIIENLDEGDPELVYFKRLAR